MRIRKRFQRDRKGVAALEFALIVPVMITLTFALIEITRISIFKEGMTQASREGARMGIRPGVTVADVQARIDEELDIVGVTNATVVIDPAQLDQAQSGDEISVRISVPINDSTWIGNFFDFGDTDITAETVMRREST